MNGLACQAKFRCPRNISQSHEFHRIARPTLHFVCVLIPGVLEYYVVGDGDMSKGSSMNMSLLRLLGLEASITNLGTF